MVVACAALVDVRRECDVFAIALPFKDDVCIYCDQVRIGREYLCPTRRVVA